MHCKLLSQLLLPFLLQKTYFVNDVPPSTKQEDLLEELLIPPPLELFITPISQQAISSTITLYPHVKDKGK